MNNQLKLIPGAPHEGEVPAVDEDLVKAVEEHAVDADEIHGPGKLLILLLPQP